MSDWSSDVCSSDLTPATARNRCCSTGCRTGGSSCAHHWHRPRRSALGRDRGLPENSGRAQVRSCVVPWRIDLTTMTTYFTDKSFRFLRALARNNERAWFQAQKADYEAHVRSPFQALLAALQTAPLSVTEHYRPEPKTVGGPLFRNQPATPLANDKTTSKPRHGP